jgi:hypothetical protein
MSIGKITAEIRYTTVYECAYCHKRQEGTTARATCTSVNELRKLLDRPPQRSHDMPVGWGCHLCDGRDVFDCGCTRRTK